ncbi:MAG: TlpA family protein disulfide reductase [Planctomycetia bacterium]|nr:TlpA family protein disulfide reductase [Planctomycetia bacterium]
MTTALPGHRAFRVTLAACLTVGSGFAAARAEDFNMQVVTAGVRLGGHVSGPKLDADALRDRVVLLEFWGVNCPPCIAAMPKLEELHRLLGPAGLVIVGAHAQGGPAEAIRKTTADLGVTFTIVEQANVEGGMDFNGIPHCMLFDHTGACIHRGSPFAVHDKAVAAVQAAPAMVLAGRALTKLAGLEQTLRDEKSYGSVLKKVAAMKASSDKETADEAAYVAERLEARGRKMLEQAATLKAADPVAATALLQRCATIFRGSDIGNEAGQMLREWKKDPAYQAVVKAGQQFAQLAALRSRLLAALGVEKPSPEVVAAVPPAVRKQMQELVKSVHKYGSGSKLTEQADAIASEFGLQMERP